MKTQAKPVPTKRPRKKPPATFTLDDGSGTKVRVVPSVMVTRNGRVWIHVTDPATKKIHFALGSAPMTAFGFGEFLMKSAIRGM